MMYLQLRLMFIDRVGEMFHEVQKCEYYKQHTMFIQAHKRSTIGMELGIACQKPKSFAVKYFVEMGLAQKIHDNDEMSRLSPARPLS